MEQFLAQVIGGGAGGLGAGKAMPCSDMGGLGNMLAGAVGGVGGGQPFSNFMGAGGAAAADGADLGAMVARLVGGLMGGSAAGLVVQVVVA